MEPRKEVNESYMDYIKRVRMKMKMENKNPFIWEYQPHVHQDGAEAHKYYEQYIRGGQYTGEPKPFVYGWDYGNGESSHTEEPEQFYFMSMIPGLPGWTARAGWNNYTTGELKGCLTHIDKEAQINTGIFQVLKFEMVSDVYKW